MLEYMSVRLRCSITTLRIYTLHKCTVIAVYSNFREAGDAHGWTILAAFSQVPPTLPETNSLHLKMDGWKTSFLLGRPIFRCYVSFREGNSINNMAKYI